MNKYQVIVLIGIIALILNGCTNENSNRSSSNDSVSITQISSNKTYDQKYANEAKKLLSEKKNIEKVVAVNTDDLLIIAIEIPHHERFQLTKMNKELSKEMDQHFKLDKLTVELATDKKIFLELEALEKKLKNDQFSKKELKKQMKQISKLLKEQT